MDSKDSDLEDNVFTPENVKKVSTVAEQEELKRQQILDTYNMKAVHDVIGQNEARPVNITNFNFLGADEKFRTSFLKRQLEPIMKHLNDGGNKLTFSTLLQSIDKAHFNLIKTDTISNMGCQMGIPERQPLNLFNPDMLNVFVNMQVVPVKKFFMKIGTNVGNGEGDGYVKLQWKNIFGGGESLDLDTNLSSNDIKMQSSRSQYMVNFSSPIFNSPDYKFSSTFFHSLRTIDYTSFHSQSIEGVTLRVGTNHLPIENKLNHEVSFENMIRNIDLKSSLDPTVGAIRNNSLMTDYFLFNAGSSFKSSFTYSIMKDTREKKYIFDSGRYIRLSHELSLFSRNKFAKTSFDYSTAYRLTPDVLFNINFKTGLLCPINGDLVHPMDKFQLGGANDVKGWLMAGMGPKQMGMGVGGNYFHALGLNVFTSVPGYRESNFKLHGFTNIGKLTNKVNVSNVLNDNCISTGVGISFAHPMAAFELNWVVPVTSNSGDSLRRGLQWGIGISFL